MPGFSTALRLGVHRWGLGGYGLFMFRFALTRAVVLVGGTAALALAGCTPSSPDEPTASPSVPVVSASPSVTVAPSETALSEEELLESIPAEARTEDFPGAAAFAAFFIDLYAPMFAPPYDTQLFSVLSEEDCKFCASALGSVAETEEVGAYSEGGEFTFDLVGAQGGLNNDGFWYVNLRFSVTDTDTYSQDGSYLNTVRGGTGTVGVKLEPNATAWRVHGVEFVYYDE